MSSLARALTVVRGALRFERAREDGAREDGARKHPRDLVGEIEALRGEIERLKRLARTDALTGLANRRAWDEELARELARARRSGQPLCVALIDIDDFKLFNDVHGHQAGDRQLVELASSWRRLLRDVDLLCRWGGDEFAVLLPECPDAQARGVVLRLRARMPAGQRCSAGVASTTGDEAAEALIARVDAALYEDKQGQRDRSDDQGGVSNPLRDFRERG